MTDRAAIAGTFADFRTVKGRKQAQLIIEVPLEKADEALRALGGVPQPSNPKWVAIVLLKPEAAQRASNGHAEPSKERRKWEDLPPAQQAAIRCGEPEFRRFLSEVKGLPVSADGAADVVRHLCGVQSRAELNTHPVPAELWRKLEADFWAWQRGMQ
jgi:hypothetical protein